MKGPKNVKLNFLYIVTPKKSKTQNLTIFLDRICWSYRVSWELEEFSSSIAWRVM